MRKTVKVTIPISSPDALIRLSKDVNKKHKALGDESPLTSLLDMEGYDQKLQDAVQLREEAKALKGQSESKLEESKLILGLGKDQNVNTTGTVYNKLWKIKNHLLAIHKGNEEKLSEWGFNVVIGTAKRGSGK